MAQAIRIADKHYKLPEGLKYTFYDSTKTAMILAEDPASAVFNGHKVIDAEDLNGHFMSYEEKRRKVEDMIFRQGGILSARPLRPSAGFLARIGIGSLPEDVDITFRDGGPHGQPPVRKFFITLVDPHDTVLHERSLYAWETAERPKQAIYDELQKILIRDYGARPLQRAKIYSFASGLEMSP